mgnify:CR=1 FL=1
MSDAGYAQFCPIAKAMEVIGEKWTLLIVRELLMGSTRFNEFQRGLSQISPTLLTKRLNTLEEHGLVVRRKIRGQRGSEYFPSESCKELMPIIEQVGSWGMRWARNLSDDDFDLELLMLYLQRSIQPDKLPGRETVIRFNFNDVTDSEYATWWLVVGDEVDICVHDPGHEVDIYFNVDLRTMCELWMGDVSYKKAIADGRLQLVGPAALTRTVSEWLTPSIFAGVAPAQAIVEPA